jgi:hypothetical protein
MAHMGRVNINRRQVLIGGAAVAVGASIPALVAENIAVPCATLEDGLTFRYSLCATLEDGLTFRHSLEPLIFRRPDGFWEMFYSMEVWESGCATAPPSDDWPIEWAELESLSNLMRSVEA